ncbi:ATP-binding protein [Mangrovimonas sp. AS39]|uniref:hybrid sensor histidine kinase/response regulator transcription factor n=1 Tax=Mangrovimonas futianensis TaxID=2895523 RepID=UPI001E282C65|nr:ATP-binding protein [Mangrovimonas futianensis]MCF1191052.1 ATP-binding protein [Mangrovimonas futianensis]MCF1194747.1 ATP-binding protein [Mangrovimonas futianensis]
MSLYKRFFTIVLLFNFIGIYAQSSIEFKQLTGDNVSTQSITYDIEQDSIGNVWIASEEGVLKHNSRFFKIYDTYDGLPENISNRTTEVFIDSKQQVWVGMENGICLYNKNFDKFDLIGKADDINPSLVNKITEDGNGNIWIGAFNGLWKFQPEKHSNGLERIIGNLVVQNIYQEGNTLYLGTGKGLYAYQINNQKSHFIKGTVSSINVIHKINNEILVGSKNGELFTLNVEKEELERVDVDFLGLFPITDFSSDKKGNLFLATDGDGLYLLNKNFNVVDHFIDDPDDQNSLNSNGIYDIEMGNEGILWIATYGGGVNYYNSNKLPFIKIQHELNNEHTLITDFTRAIAQDSNGNVWFGTKKGLSVWNVAKNSWKNFKYLSPNPQKAEDIVLSLEADGEYMWAGTYNNGLFRIHISNFQIVPFNETRDANIKLKKIYAICKDLVGNLWFAGIEEDLTVLRPDNRVETYPIQTIKSLQLAPDGDILASGRNGIYRINDQKREFKLIEELSPQSNNLAYSTISAIDLTSNGEIIVATNGAGLVYFNSNSRDVKKLTVKSGMPSDIVQGVIAMDVDDVWASTTKGLAHIMTSEKDTIIRVYDKRDGMAGTEFNYGSYTRLKDGLIAFGGVDGVTIFNPDKIKGQSHSPSIVFDGFKLFNQQIKPGESHVLEKHINETDEIVLESDENSLEIEFTGVSHGTPSKVTYSYFLEGFEEDWSEPSPNGFATYTNLNSGKYVFRVRAIDKYGNFGDERSLNVEISSPWWATNKAFFIYTFLIIGVILLIIHFTSVVVHKRHADEQIDFFNNITHEIKTPLAILLSSLDGMTENVKSNEESKVKIKRTVKRINSLFEQMLNFHKVTSGDLEVQNIMPIKVESHLKGIIDDFKPLTSERNLNLEITHKWDKEVFFFDRDIFDKIVLNLLSNAIKYSFDDGNINLYTSTTRFGDLRIEIEDHGLGIPKEQQKYILKRYYRARNAINSQRPGTGLGLVMVKKLIEKVGGSITFESEENKGTSFFVELPNLKSKFREQELVKEKTVVPVSPSDLDDPSELDDFSDNKILIVEDNDELRSILVETLGKHFQIFEASNGSEGLEVALQQFPDLILTDLIMPEMDGMEMSKKLKEDINLNHIPIFMLTVLQNSVQQIESIESGISEYIEKPVNVKYLLAKIINTFKWQKTLRQRFVQEEDAGNAALFRSKSDQEFLGGLEKAILDNIENNDFSVHDLSKQFGMSRTSLYLKLKNLVDLSPQDFIIHTKLKYAKKLLVEGQKTIKEVAYCSGFSNPKYFSTSFKKFYGQTPSGFIESLQK